MKNEKQYSKSDAHLRIYDRDGFVASFNIGMDAVQLAEEIFAYYVVKE